MNSEEQMLIKYYRISLDDESEGESGSISNQRKLIGEYIKDEPELAGMESLEFVDDGYTGTNFKRPGIQQVLELLWKNKVACIIVKDFSRFTRDYIDLGSYLEQIFPFMEVRFISINDRYDSKCGSSASGLEIPFKGLLNNLYSRDISAKVTAAKRQLIKQGRLCSGSYPFGYRKNGGGPSVYDIDEPAAKIVQLIFKLALQGKKNIEIARFLNEQKLQTPSMHKRQNGDCAHGLSKGQTSIWDSTKVLMILRDERYMGTLIIGRYQSVGMGSGKVIEAPEHMWYRKKGAIPPIVSEADFMVVQNLRPYHKRGSYKKERHLLYRKMRCGCCGRYLYFKPSDSGVQYNSFFCKQSHLDSASRCFTGYIKEQAILNSLLSLLQKQAEVYGDKDTLAVKKQNVKTEKQKLLMLEKKLEVMRNQKLEDYQRYREEEITRAEFMEKKGLLQQEYKDIEAEIDRLRNMLVNENIGDKTLEILNDSSQIEKLDRSLIELLVDVVWVYDVDRVKVDLKFGTM